MSSAHKKCDDARRIIAHHDNNCNDARDDVEDGQRPSSYETRYEEDASHQQLAGAASSSSSVLRHPAAIRRAIKVMTRCSNCKLQLAALFLCVPVLLCLSFQSFFVGSNNKNGLRNYVLLQERSRVQKTAAAASSSHIVYATNKAHVVGAFASARSILENTHTPEAVVVHFFRLRHDNNNNNNNTAVDYLYDVHDDDFDVIKDFVEAKGARIEIHDYSLSEVEMFINHHWENSLSYEEAANLRDPSNYGKC